MSQKLRDAARLKNRRHRFSFSSDKHIWKIYGFPANNNKYELTPKNQTKIFSERQLFVIFFPQVIHTSNSKRCFILRQPNSVRTTLCRVQPIMNNLLFFLMTIGKLLLQVHPFLWEQRIPKRIHCVIYTYPSVEPRAYNKKRLCYGIWFTFAISALSTTQTDLTLPIFDSQFLFGRVHSGYSFFRNKFRKHHVSHASLWSNHCHWSYANERTKQRTVCSLRGAQCASTMLD